MSSVDPGSLYWSARLRRPVVPSLIQDAELDLLTLAAALMLMLIITLLAQLTSGGNASLVDVADAEAVEAVNERVLLSLGFCGSLSGIRFNFGAADKHGIKVTELPAGTRAPDSLRLVMEVPTTLQEQAVTIDVPVIAGPAAKNAARLIGLSRLSDTNLRWKTWPEMDAESLFGSLSMADLDQNMPSLWRGWDIAAYWSANQQWPGSTRLSLMSYAYLEHYPDGLVRISVSERKLLLEIAEAVVKDLPAYKATYQDDSVRLRIKLEKLHSDSGVFWRAEASLRVDGT